MTQGITAPPADMRQINNTDDLPEIQRIERGILEAVAAFCEERGLRYYLAYGTLIGAARHAGFIPWDDDIDILMPRPDFERFVTLFAAYLQDGAVPFRLGYGNTVAGYNRLCAKVYDARTLLWETDRDNPFPEGLFIDVWPLDGTPKGTLARRLFLDRVQLLNALLKSSILHEYSGRSPVKRFIYRVAIPLSRRLIRPHALAAYISRLCKGQNYDESAYPINPVAPKLCRYRREWFEGRAAWLSFEGREYRVPCNTDGVLRCHYGDYMRLPDEAARKPHHRFVAYVEDGRPGTGERREET